MFGLYVHIWKELHQNASCCIDNTVDNLWRNTGRPRKNRVKKANNTLIIYLVTRVTVLNCAVLLKLSTNTILFENKRICNASDAPDFARVCELNRTKFLFARTVEDHLSTTTWSSPTPWHLHQNAAKVKRIANTELHKINVHVLSRTFTRTFNSSPSSSPKNFFSTGKEEYFMRSICNINN